MNSSDNELGIQLIVLPDIAYLVMGVYLTILGVCATVGNGIVIITILGNKLLKHKPHSMLLLNLAIADFGISFSGYPLVTTSTFAKVWLYGRSGCVINGFLCTLFSLVSINTLVAMSAYRYIIICIPSKASLISSNWVAIILSIGTWLISFIWAVSALDAVGWTTYQQETFGTSCSISLMIQTAGVISYNLLLALLQFILPLSVITFCYICIFKDYRISRKSIGQIGGLLTPNSYDHKITLMTFVHIVAFMFIWTPYAIIVIWSAIKDSSIPPAMTVFPTMLAKSGCLINPVLYCFSNKYFNECVKMWFVHCNWTKRSQNLTRLHTQFVNGLPAEIERERRLMRPTPISKSRDINTNHVNIVLTETRL